jgi:DNA modification methylase
MSGADRGDREHVADVARITGQFGRVTVVDEFAADNEGFETPSLRLPGRVSRIALELPEGLTFEQWEQVGRFLGRVESSVMWLIGDWWRYGDHRYGERAAQALDSETFEFQTFMDAGWVAGKIEPSRRREVLSFSHHKEVAALEPADRDRLLDSAEAECWSRNRLRAEVKFWKENVPVARVRVSGDQEGDGWAMRLGDFQDELRDLDEGSIDLIVTDPPYGSESLDLWDDLGGLGARLLTPRGLLLAWSGSVHLLDVMNRLAENLTYGWVFALMLPGTSTRVMGRHMLQEWKPVLAYSTGAWPSGEWAGDVLRSPEREKSDHPWQQNAAPARRLIERYTPPGARVLDPMAGSGSFGLAALEAGRQFLGVESDENAYATACRRLQERANRPAARAGQSLIPDSEGEGRTPGS